MAQQGDGQERTELPTPKRLEDARKKGQIARSRELSTMLILLGASAALYLAGAYIVGGLHEIMAAHFTLRRADVFGSEPLHLHVTAVMVDALFVLAPVLGVTVLIAIGAPLAVGGWGMSLDAVRPKFERMDPIKGIGRVFGARGLMKMVKAAAKFLLILGVAIIVIRSQQGAIFSLSSGNVEASLSATGTILFASFFAVSAATIVIAGIDVPFQLWQHQKQLRMSHQEIKDEMKQTDGSPEVKSRIRNMQQEVARRRMMEEVPRADVVITNPEHYAVAVRFDAATMAAPVVVAKGVEAVAANIRKVAAEHDVMVMEAPPLARAIYHTTNLGSEIPSGLYIAVARVLAYVFQLRDGAAHLEPPSDLPIPDEH